MTVILRDVQVLLGLRVNGPPVSMDTRWVNKKWSTCLTYAHEYWCSRVSWGWGDHQEWCIHILIEEGVREEGNNPHLIPTMKEETVMIIRGYILHLLGTFLFLNTKENKIALEYLFYLRIYTKQFNIVRPLLYWFICLLTCAKMWPPRDQMTWDVLPYTDTCNFGTHIQISLTNFS